MTSAKIARIRAVAAAGLGVEHWIIRHGIDSPDSADKAAFAIEQAMIELMDLAGVRLTNIQGGHLEAEYGARRAEELVLLYSADPVPQLPIPCALVLVNAAADHATTPELIYEAARASWRAGASARAIPDLPVLVFAADIVRAVHRVTRWEPLCRDGSIVPGLWVYSGASDPNLEKVYVGKSLREVRTLRPDGKWRQHGWHPYLHR
ncbi:hypothetical protein FHY52_12300 [Nocardia nova]|nr:hypothetical protein [Nocardia nova]MDN2497459.1 hypothetical protein [Nocardia nova]